MNIGKEEGRGKWDGIRRLGRRGGCKIEKLKSREELNILVSECQHIFLYYILYFQILKQILNLLKKPIRLSFSVSRKFTLIVLWSPSP